VSPSRILFRQANDKAGDAGDCRRPGLRRLTVSYFFAASFRCQARRVAGVTGKTSLQRLRRMSCASAANQALSAGSDQVLPTGPRCSPSHGSPRPAR
jgi:hypothetical protein